MYSDLEFNFSSFLYDSVSIFLLLLIAVHVSDADFSTPFWITSGFFVLLAIGKNIE